MNKNLLIGLGIFIAVIIVGFFLVMGVKPKAQSTNQSPQVSGNVVEGAPTKEFNLSAAEYAFTPSTITVNKGDKSLESIRLQKGKVMIGNLIMDKEDITLNTIEVFEKELKDAGTIVLAGPLGKYEDAGHRQGTERIFKAIVASSAFKVAGGGDTEAAISLLEMENNFDWVSVGGGAMLEYLSKKTLPGIKVFE